MNDDGDVVGACIADSLLQPLKYAPRPFGELHLRMESLQRRADDVRRIASAFELLAARRWEAERCQESGEVAFAALTLVSGIYGHER
jgi:hypothetical protein